MKGEWKITVTETFTEGECVVEHEVGGDDINEVLMVIRSIIYNPHFMNKRSLVVKLVKLERMLEKGK